MKFTECPRCGQKNVGYRVYRCDSCGGMWCSDDGDGCGAGHECPECGADKTIIPMISFNFSNVGIIVEEDEDGGDDD